MLRYFRRKLFASALSDALVSRGVGARATFPLAEDEPGVKTSWIVRTLRTGRHIAIAVQVRCWLLTTIFATTLVGCAVVDQYSGRAIVYNLEAEQAQEQALLLNIVRAYLRRPMQFTTVSTITGVASASAGVQYALPTNVPFRPATQGATGIAAFPPLPTWLFSGSMSGGPAFTVPVLDTQEFYQGILKAIPGQIWDLYIQANYPRDLLFNVFIQKVVMQVAGDDTCHTEQCEFVFSNYPAEDPRDDIQIEMFQALATYLLELGLTTEQSKPPTVDFPNPTSVNVRYVGNQSPNGKVQVLGPPGGSASSEAPPAPRPFKICFAPPTVAEVRLVDSDSLCGSSKSSKPKSKSTDDSKSNGEIAASGSASLHLTASSDFFRTTERGCCRTLRTTERGCCRTQRTRPTNEAFAAFFS
jgi:hypothetical protein